LDRSAVKHTL